MMVNLREINILRHNVSLQLHILINVMVYHINIFQGTSILISRKGQVQASCWLCRPMSGN